MARAMNHGPAGGPGEDAIRLQLQRILAGESFKRSERICRFLKYAIEQFLAGNGDELKESVLAVEVYDRPPDYDPKTDPIVRNDARRLRSKLREYYDAEGRNDPIIIEFPKGSYLPVFRERESLPPASTSNGWGIHAVINSLDGRKAIAFGAVVLLVIAFAIHRFGPWGATHAGTPVSIAVLPFINLGPDSGADYLSDGLTEDLINALANIDSLRVPARTSAFAFKGKRQDIRDIGARLNVEMILEGSVRREGNELRVTAHLNRVTDGYQVWSANYNREFKDALNIETDIAEAIAATLRLKFANGMAGRTVDPEAYNLYLQGLYFLRQGPDSAPILNKAIVYFNQAIAKDPTYGLAFAGLSDAWFNFFKYQIRHPEAIPAAEAAARRALQLDETLSEAHVSLANVLASKRDWRAADKEYKRAIELNPRNAKAHLDYASVDLALTDRLDLAIQETERAQALDPVSPEMYSLDSMLLISARRSDEAIAEAHKALEINPRSIGSQNMLGRAYVQKGMLPEATAEFAKAEGMGFRRAHWAASLAELYVKSGRRAEAEKMLAIWSKRPGQEFGHAESMAMIYAGLGKKDEAFQWLDEAYRESWGRLPWIKISPEYDSLRDDPRFSALLNRMGLN